MRRSMSFITTSSLIDNFFNSFKPGFQILQLPNHPKMFQNSLSGPDLQGTVGAFHHFRQDINCSGYTGF
jgi:hypothetical protein